MRRFSGAITLAVLACFAAPERARAADDPLAYVPSSASVLMHLRLGDVWNSTIAQEILKSAGKDLDRPLAEFKKEVGIPLETVDTATFLYPNMPQGPGDERTFVVIVTTKKPYDRDAILKKIRKKDAKAKGNLVELEEKFVLQFASDTMFLVMHQSQVEKFSKAPVRDVTPGVMTEALKLAADKHNFVMSIDFSKLPNELFTAAPPELQPFLPLLKSKSSNLFADLKEKNFKVGVSFLSADANAAEDAERSFKLLMKLAGDGLTDVLKEEKELKDYLPILPLLKELERGVKNIQATRASARLETSMALKLDMPVGEMAGKLFKKIGAESARSEGTNNLKQIGIAMHNYHDANNGFPAAAICDKKGKPLLSWRVSILPYVEQQSLYNEFKLDEPWDSEANKKLISRMPKVYAIPGAKTEGKTHYRVFLGNGAVFDLIQQARIQDITDGTSNTVMIVETVDATEWTKPDDIEFDDKLPIEKLLRFVNDQTTVAFCDGSVRSLKKGLDAKIWRLLIQKNDGEVIPNLDK